jgi:hypothetical protein
MLKEIFIRKWLASMGFQKLALTVSEYVSKMSEALSERLDNINFPTTTDEIRNIKITTLAFEIPWRPATSG